MALENVAKARSFHSSFPAVLGDAAGASWTGMAGAARVWAGSSSRTESYRFGLNAFKVLGGSFAMARYIAKESSAGTSRR